MNRIRVFFVWVIAEFKLIKKSLTTEPEVVLLPVGLFIYASLAIFATLEQYVFPAVIFWGLSIVWAYIFAAEKGM